MRNSRRPFATREPSYVLGTRGVESDVERLLQAADGFGEARVVYDVAVRAGLIWICPNAECARPHTERAGCCEDCGEPRPEPERPAAEWACVCGAVTVSNLCHCGRFRSAQLYG